jgi:integrase
MKNPYELWLNQAAESENTRRSYSYAISKFESWTLENYCLNVKDLPIKWRQAKYNGEVEKEKFLDQLNDIVKDYFAYLKGKYAPLTVNRCTSVVMSFLHAFDIPIRPIRVRYPYVVYHNRDITKEEIKTILENTDVRNRAIFLMLYESGMRPITLVNLKWKHIKEDFLTGKVPMKISLTSDILKCRVSERWTFIGEEGFNALKTYLSLRLPLKDDDLIFVPEKVFTQQKLTPQAISQNFCNLVNKLKLAESKGKKPKDLKLYCLRKAFDKYMGAVADRNYVEFWLGHTSTSTHYISLDIEHHRSLYAKAYENLRLYPPQSEDLAKLKLENIELRMQVEGLGKRLEALERLLSRPSLQIDKEALETTEKLAKRLPKKYQAEA